MTTGCGSCASCGAATTARSAPRPRAGTASQGRLERGIGVTVGMQAMNSLDQLQPVPGMGPVGEYRLLPDLDTFRVLPYAPHTGAVLTDHCGLDGEPAPVCQRSFLKRMIARLAERGLTLRVAFENEFSLARKVDDGPTCRSTRGLCFSTIATTASQDYAAALVAALDTPEAAARAVLRRARPRPAGALDRARARAAGRRRAAAGARDDPRRGGRARSWSPRWRRSRGRRTRATAATCTSRSGRASATASTRPTG